MAQPEHNWSIIRRFWSIAQKHNGLRPSLEEVERGETDLIEFEIDTDNETPYKQPVQRIPYAAWQEVASQLEKCRIME